MMQKKPPSFSAPKPTVHTLRNVQDLGQPFEAVDPFVFATFHELDAVPENADAIGRLPFCGVVCCPVSDGEDDESSSFPSEDEDGGLGQLELDLEPIADKSTARSKVLEKELERQSRAPASAGANKGTSGETVSKQGSATRTSGGPKAKSSATPVNRKQSGTTRTSEPMLIKRKRKKEHAPTSGTNRGRGTSTSTTSPASRTTKPPLKPLLMPGFPLHPHYGVDIVTMVLQGHIDHADSLGNQARIGQGDVQWLSCGWGDETKGKTSGVFQSLMFPEVRKKLQRSHKANALRVLQIWFRLPAAAFGVGHRAASYALHWAEDVPTLDRNSTRVRVLAGRWDRKTGDAMARDFLRSSGGSQQDAMDEEIDQDQFGEQSCQSKAFPHWVNVRRS
ncbi:unnamed protein product [Amoebophrya sp. A25]|nr:unnamed protein product [Amoebophrya sp. A25]|eukprot:GSA25T00020414001.1